MVPYTMGNTTHYMSQAMADRLDECELKVQEYYDSLEYVRVRDWKDIVIGEPFDVKSSKLWNGGV